MKKRILTAWCCLWLAVGLPFGASAQLLWEISGNGLEAPSYLYGTVHVSDSRAYTFSDSVLARISETDVLAGELNLDMSIFQSFQMLSAMFMPNDTTLRDLLEREQYALVKRKLDKRLHSMGLLGMADWVERMKPIYISMVLMDLSGAMEGHGSGRPALDLYLQQRARAKRKEVVGLETLEEQLSVFDRVPLREQALGLYEELAQDDGGAGQRDQLDRMLDWYAAGELDSLYQLSLAGMDSTFRVAMLDARNRNMAERMVPHWKQGKRLFVAVGAAHLPGEEGIVALLRRMGYRVEPAGAPW
jgi:hypothetical protein